MKLTKIGEVPFLVDRDKHRIVKLGGAWRIYCPERGTDDIIYARTFAEVLALSPCCPHDHFVRPDTGRLERWTA